MQRLGVTRAVRRLFSCSATIRLHSATHSLQMKVLGPAISTLTSICGLLQKLQYFGFAIASFVSMFIAFITAC